MSFTVDEIQSTVGQLKVQFARQMTTVVELHSFDDPVFLHHSATFPKRGLVYVDGEDSGLGQNLGKTNGIKSIRASDVDDRIRLASDSLCDHGVQFELIDTQELRACVAVVPHRILLDLHSLEDAI